MAAAVAVAATFTGCTQHACAGPAVLSPAVWLDASLWLAAHRGESLRACFARRCQVVDDTEREPAQLPQGNGDLGSHQRLTVSTAGIHSRQLLTRRVALKDVTEHGPCGDLHYWGMNARVESDGRVEILGWEGRFLHPATTVGGKSVGSEPTAGAGAFATLYSASQLTETGEADDE